MGIGDIGFLQQNPIAKLAGGFNTGFDTTQKVFDTSRANNARQLFGQSVEAGQLNPLLAAASPELAQQFQQQGNRDALLGIEQAQEGRAAETFDINKASAADKAKIERVARDSRRILNITDPEARNAALDERIATVEDPRDTIAIRNMPFDQQTVALQDAFDEALPLTSLGGAGAGVQSSQFIPGVGFATLTKDNQAAIIPVEGAGETAEQRREAERKKTAGLAQGAADIAVAETEQKEIIKQRVKRASDIKRELGDRNRSAARSGRLISEALNLTEQASEGLTAVGKVKLSRLFPGIDVSNESGLDSAMKQLALEQLQNFKGPTTDFEFGVTESIVGGVGNSKAANKARLNSLKRASWFNQREFDQFQRHAKNGGDPDTFRFNFGEPVDTKKGVFTLQQLQDTAVQNNIAIDDVLKRLNK